MLFRRSAMPSAPTPHQRGCCRAGAAAGSGLFSGGLGLLALALISSTAAARSVDLQPLPTNTNAGAPPTGEITENLSQSIQRRKDFPFPARCDGNTQEMVACLWQRRDRGDLRLRRLVGNEQALEHWRAARLAVCRRSAERGSGGSVQPLLWLGCENALNATLIEQITSPLLR
jgi:hypothetical protein